MNRTAWSAMMESAARMEREAQEFRRLAQDMRCDGDIGHGARCTADRGHDGEHRIERADFPGDGVGGPPRCFGVIGDWKVPCALDRGHSGSHQSRRPTDSQASA